MSSSSSDSDNSFDSDYSEIIMTEYDYEIDSEQDASQTHDVSQTSSDDEIHECRVYADDPLADEEWTANYEKEIEENEGVERRLKARLDGSVDLDEWCKCGNCRVVSLQNVNECHCCSELEGCVESMQSDLVQQDLAQGVTLKCITEHPGFNPVCLQKWSLRLAAGKFKTKGKKKYRQTGNEESFLRSVSYREFSRLVYGTLGNKRIPLPACAYIAIRKEFPASKDEPLTGFDFDEEL